MVAFLQNSAIIGDSIYFFNYRTVNQTHLNYFRRNIYLFEFLP